MLSIRYNLKVKSYQVFLFNNCYFSLLAVDSFTGWSSHKFYCYFLLLKVLRSVGLICSLNNIGDFF